MSRPSSEKIKLKPLYMCLGCSNHTYSEQYGEHIQHLDKLEAKPLQNDLWVRKKITIMQRQNLSVGATSTSTTG
jgi:hypothetical protein